MWPTGQHNSTQAELKNRKNVNHYLRISIFKKTTFPPNCIFIVYLCKMHEYLSEKKTH